MALFYDDVPRSGGRSRAVPKGIGGWLILPALGLIATPFFLAYSISESVTLIRGPQREEVELVLPGLRTAATVEMTLDSALLGLSVFTLVQFFRCKRSAPILVITLLLVNLGFMLIAAVTLSQTIGESHADALRALLPALVQQLGRALVACAIWIPYFLSSQRVGETFVVP